MKKSLLFFLLILCIPSLAQTPENKGVPPQSDVSKSVGKDSVMNKLNTCCSDILMNIDSIKANLDTVKTNTRPPNMFVEFFKNKLLEKAYDMLFGSGENKGAIPFAISVIGLLVSLLKIIWSIYGVYQRSKDGETEQKQPLLNIMVGILFFLLSALLFISTNRKYTQYDFSKINDLEKKIDLLYTEMRKDRLATEQNKANSLIPNNVPAKPAPDLNPKLNEISKKLDLVRESVNSAKDETIKKVDQEGKSTLWALVEGAMLITIFIILIIYSRKDKPWKP